MYICFQSRPLIVLSALDVCFQSCPFVGCVRPGVFKVVLWHTKSETKMNASLLKQDQITTNRVKNRCNLRTIILIRQYKNLANVQCKHLFSRDNTVSNLGFLGFFFFYMPFNQDGYIRAKDNTLTHNETEREKNLTFQYSSSWYLCARKGP